MSEVQPRPAARGRSTARGGRGAHVSRGPRANKHTNGDSDHIDTSADEGELGKLKRRHASQLSILKEMFPDWTDVDLVLAIEDSDGDVQATIEKITEGNVSQFAEVKKTKDRSRSKVKDTSVTADSASSLRGGGGRLPRGGDSVRGGRARGTDRGRGGFRGGARGGATNGTRPTGAPSIPTIESPAWNIPAVSAESKDDAPTATEEAPAAAQTQKPETPKVAAAVPEAKKTWASMFAKPKPAPGPPKPTVQPSVPQAQQAPQPGEALAQEEDQETDVEPEGTPVELAVEESVEELETSVEDASISTPDKLDEAGPELVLTPSKDELTKDNVEHLPDESQPPQTETAASTVAGSGDIGSIAGVATPLSTSTQAPIGRPAIGGYATTALKATGAPHRSASFQRRLVEQHEAVVMPGNHAVDRAAVQFGSLGLNGDVDADSLDVDEDREEAETRTQPPQHSPVQPRASLPPAPRQAPQVETQPQEANPTPKAAPGLPPPSQQHQPIAHQAQAMQNQGSQGNQPYNQFGRYGQSGLPSEPSAPPQKPYDPFGQQAPQSSQYDYPSQQQSQNTAHQQQQPQSQTGGFSSAPDSFSSQYLTSEQQRSAYQNYYQTYAQQNTPSQQEAGSAQQRTGSAFGAGPNDSAFPPSQQAQQQQSQSRYNEAQNSGHSTPNPALAGQHPTGPASQQGQHMHQPHAQAGQGGGYPYNHPYFGTPYYAAYMNQYGNYGQQQGGYGGFGGKGMYGQPHHYGVSPQASFDQHSSSPANAGGFGQSSIHGRDSALAGGLGEYGRSVSSASQSQHTATAGAGGFGGAFPDTFGRSQGGYPNQNSSYGQQQGGQQGANEDALKPFGDSKSGGPSPSALGAQPGRPGSATNAPGAGQGPQQSHQQSFGGYPGHLNQGQGNQYGGLGGLGHQGAGSHQQAGGYGQQYGGFGGGGYGSYNRGGWGTNYGQQQQH